jgi:tetratricopeptide (TPR) repeat protein
LSSGNDKISTLKQYLRENPNDSFSKFALALEFWKQDQPEKARKFFESIRQKDPEYLGVYYHLGKLYEELGDFKKARVIYDEGIELARNQQETRTLSELIEAKSIIEGDDEI